jgi:hypothetical protein
MWKFCSVLAVLSLLAPSASAEERVSFFDGSKIGWRTNTHSLYYDKKRDIIYFDAKNFVKSTLKKVGVFNAADWKVMPKKFNIYNENDAIEVSNQDTFEFKWEGFYGNLTEIYKSNIVSFSDDEDDFLVMTYGEKEHEVGFYVSGNWADYLHQKYYFKTHYDYGVDFAQDVAENLYISSSVEPHLFKIPKNLRKKAIIHRNLIYAPMGFIGSVWDKTAGCPKRPYTYDEAAEDIQKCILLIHKSIAPGVYNVPVENKPNPASFYD